MSRQPIVSKRIRRKSRKGEKYGPSVNKYAHLVSKCPKTYDARDKTFRDLPTLGKPGEVVKAGLRQIFHGRLYELVEDVMIPATAIIPGLSRGISAGMGRYKLVARID